MKHIILLKKKNEFINNVSEYNNVIPYVVYVNGEKKPLVYYSETVLSPLYKLGNIIFDDNYTKIEYDEETKSLIISSAAADFVTYDEDEKALIFENIE